MSPPAFKHMALQGPPCAMQLPLLHQAQMPDYSEGEFAWKMSHGQHDFIPH